MVSTSARIRSIRRSAAPITSQVPSASSRVTTGTPTRSARRSAADASSTDSRLVPTYAVTGPSGVSPVPAHSR